MASEITQIRISKRVGKKVRAACVLIHGSYYKHLQKELDPVLEKWADEQLKRAEEAEAQEMESKAVENSKE